MSPTEIRIRLREVEDDIARLYEEQKTLRASLAALTCPLKVGERVPVCGYSHKGKTMEITQVRPGSYGAEWMVMGKLVKADGTTGVITTDFDSKSYADAQKRGVVV